MPASLDAVASTNLGNDYLYCDGAAALLFTENETNTERLFGKPNPTPYVKDGINDYVVHGQTDRVNPGSGRHQSRRPLSPAQSTPARARSSACA